MKKGIIHKEFSSTISWFENSEKSKVSSEDYKYTYYFLGIPVFSNDYVMTGRITNDVKQAIGFSKV